MTIENAFALGHYLALGLLAAMLLVSLWFWRIRRPSTGTAFVTIISLFFGILSLAQPELTMFMGAPLVGFALLLFFAASPLKKPNSKRWISSVAYACALTMLPMMGTFAMSESDGPLTWFAAGLVGSGFTLAICLACMLVEPRDN